MFDPATIAALIARRYAIAVGVILAVAVASSLAIVFFWPQPAPSVAAPAAPQSVEVGGQTFQIPPGSAVEYTQETTHSGGILTEKHDRKSTGVGAGISASGDNVKLTGTEGQPPMAGLGADGAGTASGGTMGFSAAAVAGVSLWKILAGVCAGFAVWFLIGQKPPAKTAAAYCGGAAVALWVLGPWALVGAFLLGLLLIAWKAGMLGSGLGGFDSLMNAVLKHPDSKQILADAQSVSVASERKALLASKAREEA